MREIRAYGVRIYGFLYIRTDPTQCLLKFLKIIDILNVLSTTHALFGICPCVIPLNRTVNFPVGKNEVYINIFPLITPQKKF